MKGHRRECVVIDGKSDLRGKSSSPQAVLAQYQHRESCDFSGEPMAVALESNTFSLGHNGFLTPKVQKSGTHRDA